MASSSTVPQSGSRVLVVDDEPDLVELLSLNLERSGHTVAAAGNGREALDQVDAFGPDLIVLDVMMPELSGTEVVTRLRANPETANIPVLMLTAKGEEVDEIVGLTVGADDYVTKPFSTKVLLARIEALLRRSRDGQGAEQERTLSAGPIAINTSTHDVHIDGEPVRLTLTEFRLLTALVEARGKVLSRSTLMNTAMGPGVTVTERTIDVHVTSIRKKLGDHAALVQTVRGVGYRLTEKSTAKA